MTDELLPPPPPAPPVDVTPYPSPSQNLKQTSTLAIISLVSGILGWTLLPWIGSIAAIITGHMARKEIRQNPDTREGDGLAIGGLVLGWSCFLFGLLAILAVVLFFGGLVALIAGLGLSGQLH